MKDLEQYLQSNKIRYSSIDDENVSIDDKIYHLVRPNEDGKIFSDEFILMCDYQECDRYVYRFGGQWYYDNKEDYEKPKLRDLKYVGQSTSDMPTECFLGVRGGYEILNGSRLYEDWCAKAKFLGVKSLGICERNTLAGAMKFQIECLKSEIKPIIGATYTVFRERDDFKYDIKFFVKDELGWESLLMLNKEVNVVNQGFVKEERMLELLEGLFVVLDPKSLLYDDMTEKIKKIADFYQLDTVEYTNNDRDKIYLDSLKKYVRSDMKPVSTRDAYYLDREHSHIKRILNSISAVRDYESHNQYFKDDEDYFSELELLFSVEDDSFYDYYQRAIANEKLIADQCQFKIETGKFHLPDYILTDEQQKRYEDKYDLFWDLIERGLMKKVPKEKHSEYIARVEKEYAVIEKGQNLVDYFLILWDIIDWCDRNDICSGYGRGSAGGCLIAYLLNITNIDPLKYELLFERFLNENRVKKSLPDIDCDFEGLRRDDIKSYMEQRFGKDNVCSVGTYGNLKLKMAFTDLARLHNVSIPETKLMTKILDDCEKDGAEWNEIFYLASRSEKLKSFVKRYPEIVNDSKLCLMQPRSSSIHACATIVTPRDKDIFHYFPVKKMKNKNDEDVLISEWEGIQLDQAGFLKEDILGILQLDKIANMIKLIHQNTGVKIDFRNIPLDDYKTYQYFHKGWNEDVFQFGTKGLKKYSAELKPDNIDELSAMNALYRPGAMKSNAHNEFVLIKFGKKQPEYDYMLEEVTKKTYGLYLYQEQTMLAAQKLGGMTLVEADMMRKVMLGRGKKQQADQFYIYHDKFLAGATERGCDPDEAEKIWQKLEAFAAYGFNCCVNGEHRFKRLGFNKKGCAKFIPTIAEMYKIKNDFAYAKATRHIDLHKKFNKHGYGVAFSMNENNRIIKNKIVDIRYSDCREVFRVQLESGLYIDATSNHKFPTVEGEKRLDQLIVNQDSLFINDGYDYKVARFTFTNNQIKDSKEYIHNPFQYEYKLNSQKGKMGFQKLDTPAAQFEDYRLNYKKNCCERCGKSDCRLEVHHKNGLHGDNKFENLITVCSACHKLYHYEMGRVKQGEKGLLTRIEKIVSITSIGKMDTYDVEMADPYHNFVLDNGIVTCNSHAVAYGVTGYISQWFKVNYPIEFWTTALKFGRENQVAGFISEINQTGAIKITPVDINESQNEIYTDFDTKTIFWPLISVKQCGEKAVAQIIEDRDKNGRYYSLEEFATRHKFKGNKATKQVVENLIMSGAFDAIENIGQPTSRFRLIQEYHKLTKAKIDKEKDIFTIYRDNVKYDWWWTLQQKQLSGIAFFDYKTILERYLDTDDRIIDIEDFQSEYMQRKRVRICGYLSEVEIKNSKKGQYCILLLECNYTFVTVKIWSEQFESLAEKMNIQEQEKKLILINGLIVWDNFKGENVLQATEDTEIVVLE